MVKTTFERLWEEKEKQRELDRYFEEQRQKQKNMTASVSAMIAAMKQIAEENDIAIITAKQVDRTMNEIL